MTERLQALEVQIPILEAKLKAMKRERKALKAGETLRGRWLCPEFRARATPTGGRNQDALLAYNASRRLPWPKDSQPYKRYRALVRKGWSRGEAIEKVEAI